MIGKYRSIFSAKIVALVESFFRIKIVVPFDLYEIQSQAESTKDIVKLSALLKRVQDELKKSVGEVKTDKLATLEMFIRGKIKDPDRVILKK